MEMSEQEVEEMRASPLWPVRLASAPTVPRECRVEEGWAYRPGQFSGLTAPTLVLTGSETPPAVREATDRAAAAISNAEIQVLEGHGHFAFQADPAMVAAVIRQFVASQALLERGRGQAARAQFRFGDAGANAEPPRETSTSSKAVAPAAIAGRAGRFQPWVGGARRYFR